MGAPHSSIFKFVYGLSREIRKEEVGKLPQDQMHNISDNLEELEDHDIVRDGDFALDERARSINLTDQGSVKIEERLQDMLVKDTSLFDYDNMEILHHVNQALKAHYILGENALVDFISFRGEDDTYRMLAVVINQGEFSFFEYEALEIISSMVMELREIVQDEGAEDEDSSRAATRKNQCL